ncbi:MAG: NYN domain-containing protein, partial [Bacteroidales bacterium]|nr:NYN domain-containing protein [Bacteroidales bacterium]
MNIGILWDIENVTPPVGTNYIQSVIEAVCKDGRLSYAMAFGNWNNVSIKNIANELFLNNFELIHMPKSGKKNSADMSLIAHGVELIFQYPHIERYVIISGDGDFRPLLLSLKKHGKETWIICDVNNNASEELVRMADFSLDYRKIIKNMEDFMESDKDFSETNENIITKEKAFELFKEAVGLIISENKRPLSSYVKIKMKLLNDQFDENKLGYASWFEFVKDAKAAVNITFEKGCFVINNEENTVPEIYKILMETLKEKNKWELFSQ